jgi:hypothetical protein
VTTDPTPAAPSAPASLAERARAAAVGRTGGTDPACCDPRWITRAHQAAGHLAITLGVPTDHIRIQPSTLRRYGGWPWPELTVTDGPDTFRFLAVYGEPDQIAALAPCPFCQAEVPMFPIRTLADLGDTLGGHHGDDPVPAFDQDPAHHPDCYHAAPTA